MLRLQGIRLELLGLRFYYGLRRVVLAACIVDLHLLGLRLGLAPEAKLIEHPLHLLI